MSDSTKEEWRPSRRLDYRYEVSSHGNVRSLTRWVWIGSRRILLRGRNTTIRRNTNGYMMIQVEIGALRKAHLVHRLVAEEFVPNSGNLPHINHIDGDRTNNEPSNLEWVTPSQNMQHAKRMGSLSAATNPRMAKKLTPEKVATIREMWASGKTMPAIAALFGVNRFTIRYIVKNRGWINSTSAK